MRDSRLFSFAMIVMFLLPAAACAACGGSVVRDWGLHLQWRVERDCEHPERPARLVEVPWTVEVVAQSRGAGEEEFVPRPAPEVRAGMTVTLGSRTDAADIHLRGTALGAARTGERVRVRMGLGTGTLEGIVRGPGLVELVPRRGGN